MLSIAEGELLIRIARKVFKDTLFNDDIDSQLTIISPSETPDRLKVKRGVFLRIGLSSCMEWNEDTEILCCIGYPFPRRNLILSTIDLAIASAARIGPLYRPSVEELDRYLFELSILKSMKRVFQDNPVRYLDCINIGEDGLLVEIGPFSGAILPQVASENNWRAEDIISQACMKAGFPPDYWLISKNIRMYTFKVEIFREIGHDKKVVKLG